MSAHYARRCARRAFAALLVLIAWMAIGASGALAVPDFDGDGHAADDCAALDPNIFPGAADRPDLGIVDSNCDGVDGDVAHAFFVATTGNDAGTGSPAIPFKTIQFAVDQAAAAHRDVYIEGGTYTEHVTLRPGVGLYGGYQPGGGRATSETTTIQAPAGAAEAVLGDGATGVVLQLLTIKGADAAGTDADGTGRTSYALRAINGSSLALEGVSAVAGKGTDAGPGPAGGPGADGAVGACGGWHERINPNPPPVFIVICGFIATGGFGGQGGDPSVTGGSGGSGHANAGGDGGGQGGGAGGGSGGGGGFRTCIPLPMGGCRFIIHRDGAVGGDGANPGGTGTAGAGGTFDPGGSGVVWVNGSSGHAGARGGNGDAGGGGGAGLGAHSATCNTDLWGGPGGGGGGGGQGGAGGGGGPDGGGSLATYLFNSTLVAASSSLSGGPGGAGGDGGTGGGPGHGQAGGVGEPGQGSSCTDATPGNGAAGGAGKDGGQGGPGGGGTGGPSAGLLAAGTAAFFLSADTHAAGSAGGTGGHTGGTTTKSGDDGPSAGVLPGSAQNSAATDFDGDGVADASDPCPAVAGSAGGCPPRGAVLPDRDGDGVPDGADACPDTAGGVADANFDGCSDLTAASLGIVDDDHDGFSLPKDCNDHSAAIHPGAHDTPGDKVDQDCDGKDAAFPRLAAAVTNVWAVTGRRLTAIVLKIAGVPKGAKIAVTCSGDGCPFKHKHFTARKRGSVNLLKLLGKGGGRFHAGEILTIRVTAPGLVGRAFVFALKANKIPKGRALCLPPGAKKPTSCS